MSSESIAVWAQITGDASSTKVRDVTRVVDQLTRVASTSSSGSGTAGSINWRVIVNGILTSDGFVQVTRWHRFYAAFGPMSSITPKVAAIIKGTTFPGWFMTRQVASSLLRTKLAVGQFVVNWVKGVFALCVHARSGVITNYAITNHAHGYTIAGMSGMSPTTVYATLSQLVVAVPAPYKPYTGGTPTERPSSASSPSPSPARSQKTEKKKIAARLTVERKASSSSIKNAPDSTTAKSRASDTSEVMKKRDTQSDRSDDRDRGDSGDGEAEEDAPSTDDSGESFSDDEDDRSSLGVDDKKLDATREMIDQLNQRGDKMEQLDRLDYATNDLAVTSTRFKAKAATTSSGGFLSAVKEFFTGKRGKKSAVAASSPAPSAPGSMMMMDEAAAPLSPTSSNEQSAAGGSPYSFSAGGAPPAAAQAAPTSNNAAAAPAKELLLASTLASRKFVVEETDTGVVEDDNDDWEDAPQQKPSGATTAARSSPEMERSSSLSSSSFASSSSSSSTTVSSARQRMTLARQPLSSSSKKDSDDHAFIQDQSTATATTTTLDGVASPRRSSTSTVSDSLAVVGSDLRKQSEDIRSNAYEQRASGGPRGEPRERERGEEEESGGERGGEGGSGARGGRRNSRRGRSPVSAKKPANKDGGGAPPSPQSSPAAEWSGTIGIGRPGIIGHGAGTGTSRPSAKVAAALSKPAVASGGASAAPKAPASVTAGKRTPTTGAAVVAAAEQPRLGGSKEKSGDAPQPPPPARQVKKPPASRTGDYSGIGSSSNTATPTTTAATAAIATNTRGFGSTGVFVDNSEKSNSSSSDMEEKAQQRHESNKRHGQVTPSSTTTTVALPTPPPVARGGLPGSSNSSGGTVAVAAVASPAAGTKSPGSPVVASLAKTAAPKGGAVAAAQARPLGTPTTPTPAPAPTPTPTPTPAVPPASSSTVKLAGTTAPSPLHQRQPSPGGGGGGVPPPTQTTTLLSSTLTPTTTTAAAIGGAAVVTTPPPLRAAAGASPRFGFNNMPPPPTPSPPQFYAAPPPSTQVVSAAAAPTPSALFDIPSAPMHYSSPSPTPPSFAAAAVVPTSTTTTATEEPASPLAAPPVAPVRRLMSFAGGAPRPRPSRPSTQPADDSSTPTSPTPAPAPPTSPLRSTATATRDLITVVDSPVELPRSQLVHSSLSSPTTPRQASTTTTTTTMATTTVDLIDLFSAAPITSPTPTPTVPLVPVISPVTSPTTTIPAVPAPLYGGVPAAPPPPPTTYDDDPFAGLSSEPVIMVPPPPTSGGDSNIPAPPPGGPSSLPTNIPARGPPSSLLARRLPPPPGAGGDTSLLSSIRSGQRLRAVSPTNQSPSQQASLQRAQSVMAGAAATAAAAAAAAGAALPSEDEKEWNGYAYSIDDNVGNIPVVTSPDGIPGSVISIGSSGTITPPIAISPDPTPAAAAPVVVVGVSQSLSRASSSDSAVSAISHDEIVATDASAAAGPHSPPVIAIARPIKAITSMAENVAAEFDLADDMDDDDEHGGATDGGDLAAKEDKKEDLSDFNTPTSVAVTNEVVSAAADEHTRYRQSSVTLVAPSSASSSSSVSAYGSYSATGSINAPGVVAVAVPKSEEDVKASAYSSLAYDQWHHDAAPTTAAAATSAPTGSAATPSLADMQHDDDGKVDAAKQKKKKSKPQVSAYGAYGEYGDLSAPQSQPQPSSSLAYGTTYMNTADLRMDDPIYAAAAASVAASTAAATKPANVNLAPVIAIPEVPSTPAPPRDRVNFSAFSPPSVPPASRFPLYVWAYLPEDRKKVLKEAMKTEAAREVGSKGDVAIARGTTISVTLAMPTDSFHVRDDCATKHVQWTGKYTNVFFDVDCLEGATEGYKGCKAFISVCNTVVAIVSFNVSVMTNISSDKLQTVLTRALSVNAPTKPAPPIPSSTTYVSSILALYTPPDLPLVQRFRDNLAWVNGDIQFDLNVVERRAATAPSQTPWLDALNNSETWTTWDLVQVFWTARAATDHWVNQEWQAALKARTSDFVQVLRVQAGVALPPALEAIATIGGGAPEPAAPSLLSEEDAAFSATDVVLHDEIGRGNFGVAYRALVRGKEMVVKIVNLPPDYTQEEMMVLVMEAAFMRRLSRHPNIVKFGGACVHKGDIWMASEFCAYGSLDSLLEKLADKLTHAERLQLCVGAAMGVAQLHSEGVLHRDIAARNFLVDASMTVKLADFGMSREGSARHLLFAVDKALPLKWAAPESLLVQMFSNGSDVWSLGIALWEILTGLEPYPGLAHDQAARQVVQQGMRCTIPAWVPEPLQRTMTLCWSHDPKIRPSAAAVVAAANEALAMLDAVRSPVSPITTPVSPTSTSSPITA